MKTVLIPAVLLGLSGALGAATLPTPFTFSSKATKEALGAFTACMVTASEVNPYSTPQDLQWRCDDRVSDLRLAAEQENASRPTEGRLHAIDMFIIETRQRVIRQVLAE